MQKMKSFLQSQKEFIRQFFLYGLIGVCSSILDTVCYVFLTRNITLKWHLANFISVNIGIACSFILNTYFNFKKSNKLGKRAISFFAVGYCGLGLSFLLLHIGTNLLHINDIIVKLVSIVFVAAFQFILNKIITYSKI